MTPLPPCLIVVEMDSLLYFSQDTPLWRISMQLKSWFITPLNSAEPLWIKLSIFCQKLNSVFDVFLRQQWLFTHLLDTKLALDDLLAIVLLERVSNSADSFCRLLFLSLRTVYFSRWSSLHGEDLGLLDPFFLTTLPVVSKCCVSVCFLVYFGSFSVLFCSRFYYDFVSPVSAILDPHLFVLVSAAPHCFCIVSPAPHLFSLYIYPLVSSGFWDSVTLPYNSVLLPYNFCTFALQFCTFAWFKKITCVPVSPPV